MNLRGFALALALCVAPAAAQQADAPVRQPALWAVSDADSTMYLFGTVHLGISGDNWGGPAAREALARAQVVWTEIDMASAQGETIQRLVRQYGAAERPLSQIVGPQRWSQISKRCAEIGASADGIDRLRPWVAALIFATPELIRNPQAAEQSADRMVERQVAAAGPAQRRQVLETAEQQVMMFAGMPEATQLAMLYEALDGAPASKDDNVVAAWAVGDDAAIARIFVDTVARPHPEVYDAIIRRRNAAWVDVLARELEGSGVEFVAVGAGHLAGPDSLQAMLAAKGYRVTRLTPPPR